MPGKSKTRGLGHKDRRPEFTQFRMFKSLLCTPVWGHKQLLESDPHHVFLYEVYDDATALEAHRATAHFKKYWEATAPMIAKRVARHMSPIAFNIKAR